MEYKRLRCIICKGEKKLLKMALKTLFLVMAVVVVEAKSAPSGGAGKVFFLRLGRVYSEDEKSAFPPNTITA